MSQQLLRSGFKGVLVNLRMLEANISWVPVDVIRCAFIPEHSSHRLTHWL